MLDHEPDANQTTTSTDTPPARPRRRAASRPAGPPAARPAAEPQAAEPTAPDVPEQGLEPAFSAAPDPVSDPVADRLDALVSSTAGQTEPSTSEAPADVEAPARPARRRTRKTAAAPPEEPADQAADQAPEQAPEQAPAPEAERPARRRSRKAAAPAVPADEPVAPVTEAVEQPGSPEPEPEPAGADVPATDAPTLDIPAIDSPAIDSPALDTPTPDSPAVDEADAELVDPDALVDQTDAAVDAEVESAEPTLDEVEVEVASDEAAEAASEAASDEAGEAEQPEDSEDSEESEGGGDGGRRRRRRRGGRRRRRSGDSDDAAESDEPEGADDSDEDEQAAGSEAAPGATADDETTGDEQAEGAGEEGDGSRRRRRRRRRRGEDAGSAPDDPTDTVVRVREPRRSKSAEDQVTGISGSTRMEAKRQRRREGREAGRRRAPILSEAEFLARRESVTRKMIIRQRADLTQIAVLEDDILVEHYVDRESATSLIGNVYLGRVQNVLPSMEAAFVDIGRGRNAVLYAGEVDWDSFGAQGQNRKVEKVLKSGQTVLVQVTKDPVGAKGARLTNHVSIPGRYIVYAPSGHLSGISRKLPENERKRLKDILSGLVGEASVIVRTAAEGASEDELVRDVNRLQAQWADIETKVAKGQGPQLLYGEPDLTVRIVRDLFTEDFSELVVSGDDGPEDAYEAIEAYVKHVAPHLEDRLKRYEPGPDDARGTDVFTRHRIDEQISKALERKVFLPSGGSLVIDRTEAMTVIDVNTGKFTGSGGNLEATVTSNNLEAAEEIVRQLRLRDLGGIIVIDFIDMVLPANRELLLRRLVECLGRDRTRHQVAEVTSLGLVQMTRKRIGTGLLEAFGTECPVCHGRGYELHDEPVESQRPADGGARENRGSRRGGSSGNGSSHDDPGSRSGRSRGGRGRRASSDTNGETNGAEPDHDDGHHEAAQLGIAAVAAGSGLGSPEADA